MKTCLECLQPQPDSAETCSECGGGSWGTASPALTLPESLTSPSVGESRRPVTDTDPAPAQPDDRSRKTGKGR